MNLGPLGLRCSPFDARPFRLIGNRVAPGGVNSDRPSGPCPHPPGGLSPSNRCRGGRGSSQFEALGASNRASKTLPQAYGPAGTGSVLEPGPSATTTKRRRPIGIVLIRAAFGWLREDDGSNRGDEEQEQPPIQDPSPYLFEEFDASDPYREPPSLDRAPRSDRSPWTGWGPGPGGFCRIPDSARTNLRSRRDWRRVGHAGLVATMSRTRKLRTPRRLVRSLQRIGQPLGSSLTSRSY
jgi:hypothetical protein